MSRRNMVWLAAIVVVFVTVGVLGGWLWGVLAAVATLVVSEIVERTRRTRRRRERGAAGSQVSVRDAVESRRRR